MSKFVKQFVIDASVARAAGTEIATDKTSIRCREFLKATYNARHRIVISQDISIEWKNHASVFSKRWLASMRRVKRIIDVGNKRNPDIRNAIEVDESFETEKQRAMMRKDCHLIEAALATDERVISLDDTVRNLFSQLASTHSVLQNILWVNPDREEEIPIQWVKEGAKYEQVRCLGYQGSS